MEPGLGYYFPTNPPYFLCSAALIAGIACGLAFKASLEQLVQDWQKNRAQANFLTLQSSSIRIPYVGMSISIVFFLAAALEVYGLPPTFAYGTSIVLTSGSGWFVWRQLSKLLVELERGGSAAMDLDVYEDDFAGKK